MLWLERKSTQQHRGLISTPQPTHTRIGNAARQDLHIKCKSKKGVKRNKLDNKKERNL